MRVRKATIDDSATIAQIQVDSYRTAYAGIFPPVYLDHFTYEEQTQDWRDLLSSDQDDVLLVVETKAGEIVGYALGRPGLSEIPPYDGELVAIHIRRSYQGQGIGRQLFSAIAQQLRQKGCASLMLWVLEKNPARGFYEHLSGRLIGTQDWGGNDEFGVRVREMAYGWPNIEDLSALEG